MIATTDTRLNIVTISPYPNTAISISDLGDEGIDVLVQQGGKTVWRGSMADLISILEDEVEDKAASDYWVEKAERLDIYPQ